MLVGVLSTQIIIHHRRKVASSIPSRGEVYSIDI